MNDRAPRALKPPVRPPHLTPAPGRRSLVMAAVILGGLMLALQFWLLTTALDLFLAGEGDHVWQLAAASAIVFLGGVLALVATDGDTPSA